MVMISSLFLKVFCNDGLSFGIGVLIMTENEWTEKVCKKLRLFLKPQKLYADTLQRIPYSQEIIGYTDAWDPEYMEPTRFETDLVIYEKKDETIIPRVIIEAKLTKISTHDAITYSYKAEKHKFITPYLRYGIMIGNRKHYALPGRLFRHGTNFDFMIAFSGTRLTEDEWITFTEMLLKEIEYSRNIEKMLHESRKTDRNHYFMLQKQLILKEIDNPCQQ